MSMKLIATEKEPGCFVHLTPFELVALYKGLELALCSATRPEASQTLEDTERQTLVALRTQISRYQKGAK